MSVEDHTRHFGIFPIVVQSTQYPDAARLNDRLLPEIEKLRQVTPASRQRHSASKAYTTVESCNDLHMRPEFEELISFFLEEIEEFAKYQQIKYKLEHIFINSCWFNIFNKNTFIDSHNHPNSVFTGVYYLKTPEGGAELVLESELIDQMSRTPAATANEFNVTTRAVAPRPGLLVLFNSNIMHRTQLHKIPDERVSISFTAMV